MINIHILILLTVRVYNPIICVLGKLISISIIYTCNEIRKLTKDSRFSMKRLDYLEF